MSNTTEHLTVAQTAAVIRKELARRFPRTTFWVRSNSYAGGASIDIYFDGADGWEKPDACYCGGAPTGVTQPGDACSKCRFIPRWQRKLKPGAPTKQEVETFVRGFQSKGFDGMIDLSYYIDAYLDEKGNVVGTVSEGTAGSRGTVAAWDGPIKTNRRVSFGSDYIFVNDEPPFDVRQKRGA